MFVCSAFFFLVLAPSLTSWVTLDTFFSALPWFPHVNLKQTYESKKYESKSRKYKLKNANIEYIMEIPQKFKK